MRPVLGESRRRRLVSLHVLLEGQVLRTHRGAHDHPRADPTDAAPPVAHELPRESRAPQRLRGVDERGERRGDALKRDELDVERQRGGDHAHVHERGPRYVPGGVGNIRNHRREIRTPSVRLEDDLAQFEDTRLDAHHAELHGDEGKLLVLKLGRHDAADVHVVAKHGGG